MINIILLRDKIPGTWKLYVIIVSPLLNFTLGQCQMCQKGATCGYFFQQVMDWNFKYIAFLKYLI